MLSPCAMDGALPISLLSMYVINTSPLSMLSVVHMGNFPQCGTMKSDLTASLLRETCSNVGIKLGLQHVTTEVMTHRSAIVQDDARLDI